MIYELTITCQSANQEYIGLKRVYQEYKEESRFYLFWAKKVRQSKRHNIVFCKHAVACGLRLSYGLVVHIIYRHVRGKTLGPSWSRKLAKSIRTKSHHTMTHEFILVCRYSLMAF